MPRLTPDELAHLIDDDSLPIKRRETPSRPPQRHSRLRRTWQETPFRPQTRANERKPFKCGRCRAFVGAPLTGGLHRNHCPLCLTSRHVDRHRPGDRSSPCRALMPAIGVAFRGNGEQMVVHRCNGCGIERQNRVAADDNPIALLYLPPVVPARRQAEAEEEIA